MGVTWYCFEKDTRIVTMEKSSGLKEQLGRYRTRYHRLALWRGLLIWLGILIVSLSVLALGEYFFYFSTGIKTTLLILWIGTVSFFTWVHVLQHSFALLFNFRALSDRQIAVKIGSEDSTVEDKIVNYLELMNSQSIAPEYLNQLIEQKTKELSNVDFFSSLDTSRLKRAGWVVGIPTILLMTYAAFDAQTIVEGSNRFFNVRTAYSPKAPFEFVVENDWEVEKGKSLTLRVSVKGSTVPESMNTKIGDDVIPMRKAKGHFEWTIERTYSNQEVYFEAMGFLSERYELSVKDVPALIDLNVAVFPPAYTGRDEFEFNGSQDALIPEGSEVVWMMRWSATDSVSFSFKDEVISANRREQVWQIEKRINEQQQYQVQGLNTNGTKFKTGLYTLNILKDTRPSLEMDWAQDSVTGFLYLKGNASDDYRVSNVYVTLFTDGGEEVRRNVNGSFTNFNFVLTDHQNWSSFSVTAVDNDALHGGKSTTVGPFRISVLDVDQRREELNQRDRETVENIERFQQRQQEAQEMRERLNQRMIEGSNQWQMNQMRQQMQQQQEQLMNQWNEMKRELERQNQERILNDGEENELTEKREQLQELLENMDTEKLDELLKELEEEGENMNEDNLRDWMRRVERENQRMEMDADRLEELMKRLNFEQNLNDFLEKLDDLQSRQQDLAESDTDTKDDQDALNEEFNDLMEEMEQLIEENQNLDSPMPIDMPEDLGEQTEQSMQESSNELEKSEQNNSESSPQSANDKQQKSSQSMSQMMESMSSSIMSMQMEMHIENRENLRRILTNLVHLSEDQETLLLEEGEAQNSPDALVVAWMRDQQDMRKAFEVVDDSLMAIAKRVPEMNAVVTKWIVQVREEMDRSNATMSERQMPQANSSMRESMLALNELANLIDITMDQIQAQMAAAMPGNQACEKPGGQKPSMSNMRARQQQLSQQMQQMGQNPGNQEGEGQGENGEGRGEGQGQRGDAQQIVQMMSRQAQIRKMLEERGSTGNNGNKSLEDLLEENERDLARRNFDTEFFERQKEIEVRMLELEEAERLQEQDDQRESETGSRYQELREDYLEEFLRIQRNRREEIRFETPLLTPYYRERSSAYLRR